MRPIFGALTAIEGMRPKRQFNFALLPLDHFRRKIRGDEALSVQMAMPDTAMAVAKCVLPVPGPPMNTAFSALSVNDSVASSLTRR